ncbi:hypothetical protein BDZ88DRAFT_470793, partial [Geranomyces variabilis]
MRHIGALLSTLAALGLPLSAAASAVFSAYPDLNVTRAHNDQIRNIKYYNGTIISTGYDNAIKQWSVANTAATLAPVQTITTSSGASGLEVSMNGSIWAGTVGITPAPMYGGYISSDTGLINTGMVRTYAGPTNETNEIILDTTVIPNRLWVASSDHYAYLYTSAYGSASNIPYAARYPMTDNALRTTTNGANVFVGGVEYALRKFDMAGNLLAVKNTTSRINGFVWLNGTMFIAIHDGTVISVNPSTLETIATYRVHPVGSYTRWISLINAAGSTYIMTTSNHGEIKQWTTSMVLVGSYYGLGSTDTALSIADDGDRLWVGDSAGNLRNWIKQPVLPTTTVTATTSVSKTTTTTTTQLATTV